MDGKNILGDIKQLIEKSNKSNEDQIISYLYKLIDSIIGKNYIKNNDPEIKDVISLYETLLQKLPIERTFYFRAFEAFCKKDHISMLDFFKKWFIKLWNQNRVLTSNILYLDIISKYIPPYNDMYSDIAYLIEKYWSKSPASLCLKGTELLKKDNYAAIKHFIKAIEIDNSFDYAYLGCGMAYSYLKNWNLSYCNYKKLLDSKDSSIYHNLHYLSGDCCYNLKAYDEAEKHFTIQLDSTPDDIKTHNYLGTCLNKQKKYSKAIDVFSKAIRIDDSCQFSYKYKILALKQLGMYEDIIKLVDLFLDNNNIYPGESFINEMMKYKELAGKKLVKDPVLKPPAKIYEYGARFVIDLKTSEQPSLNLHRYQKDAITKLREFFSKKSSESVKGLLVMPTGSGKTRTSVIWMLQEMIRNGYKVIWIAHRNNLLEQAADTMCTFSPVVNLPAYVFDKVTFLCISSELNRPSQALPDDNVDLFTIQTLYNSKDRLSFILEKNIKSKKILVIIDEAHHAVSRTYRVTLDEIARLCPGYCLLGLTATPSRMQEDERRHLLKMFDNKIIHSVTLSELIVGKYLAKPIFINVRTEVEPENDMTKEEAGLIRKFKEIPESMVSKIAKLPKRNKKIIMEYTKNKGKYGKTLVFALNQEHCVTLAEEFRRNGINCDYVISDKEGNTQTIEKFKKNQFDVMINVGILTEGTDVPDIQTVFLTRPTQSDVLLMQMIGRGMRGPQTGGTESVYIVDFEDTWLRFQNWLNPQFIIENIEGALPGPIPEKKADYTAIPWEIVQQIYDNIQPPNIESVVVYTLPVGWYSVTNDEGRDIRIMVFENQKEQYELIEKNIMSVKNHDMDVLQVMQSYFAIDDPVPLAYELSMILNCIKNDGIMPEYFSFTERDRLDIGVIVNKIKESNMPIMEIYSYIDKMYEMYPLIKNLYGSLNEFKERVFRHISGIPLLGSHIEIIQDKTILRKGSSIYLENIAKQVFDSMFDENSHMPPVSWSGRPYKSNWAFCRISDKNIFINPILDSPDVPIEVIKFLIYHEMLHANGLWDHDKEFYRLEHKFNDFARWDAFLDTLNEKYHLEYNKVNKY